MSTLKGICRPCQVRSVQSLYSKGFRQPKRAFTSSQQLRSPLTQEEIQGAHKYCVSLLTYVHAKRLLTFFSSAL